MKLVVLGLGNPIRSDDGVGFHALQKLSTYNQLPRDIQLIDGGTLGLDLLPSLRGVSHLLALDAVDTGSPSGTLTRFANAELAGLPVSKSVHLLGFADLLGTLRLLGDSPEEVILLGLQPESTDWGVVLSPAVDAAVDGLVAVALAQISTWVDTRGVRTEPLLLAGRMQARLNPDPLQ
jgi:hydrogenase maturation protease